MTTPRCSWSATFALTRDAPGGEVLPQLVSVAQQAREHVDGPSTA